MASVWKFEVSQYGYLINYAVELFRLLKKVENLSLSQSDSSILSRDDDVTHLISLSQSDFSILSRDRSMPHLFYLITYAEELKNRWLYWKFGSLWDFKPFLFLCKCINMSENLAISREYWSLIPVNFLAFNSPCKGAKSTMPPIIYTKSSRSRSSSTLECEKNTI